MADQSPNSEEVKSACPAEAGAALSDATLAGMLATLVAGREGLPKKNIIYSHTLSILLPAVTKPFGIHRKPIKKS